MVIRHTLQKLSSVMIGRPPALAALGSSPTLQLQRSTPPHWQTHLTLSRTTRRSPHSTCSIVSSIALSSFLCNNCYLHLLRHFPPSRLYAQPSLQLLINNSLPDLPAGILAGITNLLGSFDLKKTFATAIGLR